MVYLALVMAGLTGFLTDKWLERATVKDPVRLIVAVVVAVLVFVLTATSKLASF